MTSLLQLCVPDLGEALALTGCLGLLAVGVFYLGRAKLRNRRLRRI